MDDTHFEPLADTLRGRRSRRQTLRLLAGGVGALALGAGRDRAEAAVTRLPALPKGWTHLAGTTTGLLCYRRKALPTGYRGTSGTCVDGRFEAAVTLDTYGKWGTIVGASRSLLFYSDTTEWLTTGYLDAAGRPVFSADAGVGLAIDVMIFPGTRSGRLAVYKPYLFGENLVVWALTADGHRPLGRPTWADVGLGWTHGAGAGSNACLLYSRDTGAALTGRIEQLPPDPDKPVYEWVTRATYQFAAGWTHVAGTFNGGLLFYNRSTGKGLSGWLDASGNWRRTTPNLPLGANWTHVVGAGGRGILFYNATTGKGVGGFLTTGGVWSETTTYD